MADAGSKKALAAPTPIKVKRQVVAISVKFELNARNGLRRVVFGLLKSAEGEAEKWMIEFQLFERDRKADEFTKLVDLAVKVDSELNKKAERAAHEGLSEKQASHALGSAAEDAKAAEAKEIEEEEAQATIAETLKKN